MKEMIKSFSTESGTSDLRAVSRDVVVVFLSPKIEMADVSVQTQKRREGR